MSSFACKNTTFIVEDSQKKKEVGQQQQYSSENIVVSPSTETKQEEKNQNQNQNNYGIYESFDSMGLKLPLLRGIYAHGFEKPSAIQQRGIMPIISGKDTIAQAQSGTGKTGTFSIGCLQKVDPSLNCCQILIISPTRELSIQTFKVCNNLAHYLANLNIYCCIGGTSVKDDILELKKGDKHIIIGTPGRINHMISSEILSLSNLKTFILDEADEMLSRGFKSQIYEIFQYLPNDVQVGLFSATMPNEILLLTDKFMRSDAVKILVKKEEITLDGLQQYYVRVEKEQYKFAVLSELYSTISIAQCIIFCNSRRKVNWLTDQLKQNNFTVSFIHGCMDMNERKLILNQFRNGLSRILISTDLLGRGIDVHSVSLVINYDLPKDKENYIHRIGRAARF